MFSLCVVKRVWGSGLGLGYFGDSLPNFITTSPERFWRHVGPISGDCDVFDIEGVQVGDAIEISNVFNEQFKSVSTVDDGIVPQFDVIFPPVPNVAISEAGILNMILKPEVKKSPGPDDIPNAFFFKDMQNGLKNTCVFCFLNYCLKDRYRMTGESPRVKPIHENGRKKLYEELPSNLPNLTGM